MRRTLIVLALAAPAALVSVGTAQDTGETWTFTSCGQCERQIKQDRNEARRTAQSGGENAGEVNKSTKATQVCEAFTDGNGKRMFRIVSQSTGGQ